MRYGRKVENLYGYQTYQGLIPAVILVEVMLKRVATDYININKQLTDMLLLLLLFATAL